MLKEARLQLPPCKSDETAISRFTIRCCYSATCHSLRKHCLQCSQERMMIYINTDASQLIETLDLQSKFVRDVWEGGCLRRPFPKVLSLSAAEHIAVWQHASRKAVLATAYQNFIGMVTLINVWLMLLSGLWLGLGIKVPG